MQNERPEKAVNNAGFNYALYLKSPNIRMKDQEARNLKASLDANNTSIDEKSSKHCELGNCLSDDLLNKIDVGSPMKSINNDNFNILQLNLEECEVDRGIGNISPIGKDKMIRLNLGLEKDSDKQLTQLVSPEKNEKSPFFFSKNFPMKKFIENPQHQSQNNIENNSFENYVKKKSNGNFYTAQSSDYSLSPERRNPNNYQQSSSMNNYNQGFQDNSHSRISNNPYPPMGFSKENDSLIPNFKFNGFNNQNIQFNNNQARSQNQMNNMNQMNNKSQMNGSTNLFTQSNNNNDFYKFGQNNEYINNNINYNVDYNQYSKQTNMNNFNDLKKKKQFVDREGDWVCMRCKNKNFSFRVLCNRCKLPKRDSEEMYSEHMKSLMNLVQMNEIMQNKIFNQNCPNLAQNRQGFHNFDPTLFSPNSCPIYDENVSDLYSINATYTYKDNQTFQN
jgi:hypothetical protein